MVKTITKGALVLLAGLFMGTALLWLSYLLPVTEESAHVLESMQTLEQEGWYPTVPLMHQDDETLSRANPGGILDNFTDSIMITTAGYAPKEGALYQAMNMAGNEMTEGYNYYWHGYVAILRPLLLFLNYADLRVLNSLLQMSVTAALACMLYRRKGFPWAALALTIYGLLLPIAVSQALQYSWVFYIGMCGSLVIVKFHRNLAKGNGIYFLFLILGMLTSYMDLLTYPLFTWGIPMIWWIVMGNDNEGEKNRIFTVILCGIAWICGYGGLWAGKWLIGGIILQRPIFATAWHEVLYRAGTLPDTLGYEVSHLQVVLQNLDVYQSIQGLFLLGAWVLWWGYRALEKAGSVRMDKTASLLLVALSPIAWYIVLHNHTYVHSSFTYRIWTVGLAALLAALIGSLEKKMPEKRSGKGRVLPAVIALAALVGTLQVKDESYLHNGNFVPSLLELEENTELLQGFSPSYGSIPDINLLLETETDQPGEIVIRFLEEGRPLEEFTLAAREAQGGVFYRLPVNLRLKAGAEYQIGISGRGLENGHISVGVTDIGLHPLAELSVLQTEGQLRDAQLICGVRYRHRASLRRLTLALELQLLLYWSLFLLLGKIIYSREVSTAVKHVITALSGPGRLPALPAGQMQAKRHRQKEALTVSDVQRETGG